MFHLLPLASSYFPTTRRYRGLNDQHFVTIIKVRKPGHKVPGETVCSSGDSRSPVHHQLTDTLRTMQVALNSACAEWLSLIVFQCRSFTLVIILQEFPLALSYFTPTRIRRGLRSLHFATIIQARKAGHAVPGKLGCSSGGSRRIVRQQIDNLRIV